MPAQLDLLARTRQLRYRRDRAKPPSRSDPAGHAMFIELCRTANSVVVEGAVCGRDFYDEEMQRLWAAGRP
jgi:hypothetical protein